MTMTHQRLDLAAAIHEGSHAVAAERLGLGLRWCFIDTTKPGWIPDGLTSLAVLPGRTNGLVVCFLAGFLAVKKAGLVPRKLNEASGRADFQNIRQRLPLTTTPLRVLVRDAQDLVEENWDAILNAASHLFLDRALDQVQVRSILDTGYCPPMADPSVLQMQDSAAAEAALGSGDFTCLRQSGKRLVQLAVRLSSHRTANLELARNRRSALHGPAHLRPHLLPPQFAERTA